jgi:hypothetical protein
MGDVWVALVSSRTLAVMPKVNKLIPSIITVIVNKASITNSGIVVTKAVFTAAGRRRPIGMTAESVIAHVSMAGTLALSW